MARIRLLALLGLLLAGLILLLGRPLSLHKPTATARPQLQPPSQPLPGESILVGYGQPHTRPEEDLTQVFRALSNLMLLIKSDAPFAMGANEEFAAALRGKNRHQLRFLPDTHACFNARGQLIDRWGSPLFFHVIDRDRLDIRSAGPDRAMWTSDDLHRRYDGQFIGAEALNPASLDQMSTR